MALSLKQFVQSLSSSGLMPKEDVRAFWDSANGALRCLQPGSMPVREVVQVAPAASLIVSNHGEIQSVAHAVGWRHSGSERDADVHERTANEVFGPLSAIPPEEQRRIANRAPRGGRHPDPLF